MSWDIFLLMDSSALLQRPLFVVVHCLRWDARAAGLTKSSSTQSVSTVRKHGGTYYGSWKRHLIYIAAVIKKGMSLIILPSVCSINHKGPVKHVADGDDDKPTLRNYAKGGVRFWSDFKARAYKPHSCFICLPSHRGCTLKASFAPCEPKLETVPSFL